MADWDAVASHPCLAQRKIIRVDLPGHGDSPYFSWGDDPFLAVSEALAAILDAEQCADADLAGYSMGGRLALFSALYKPTRWKRLVLIGASPGLEAEAEVAARQAWDAAWAERFKQERLADVLADWYDMPLFASLRHHPAFSSMWQRRLQNDGDRVAEALGQLGTGQQPRLWDRLSELSTPTLVLAGEKDEKYVRLAGAMAHRASTITASVLPEAGHAIHQEQPASLAQEICTFFTST